MQFNSILNSKKIILLIVFIASVAGLNAKSAKKQKKDANETEKPVKIAKSDSEWCIYQKSLGNIYKGPFNSLEDVISAWINDPSLQPRNNFFIGKNKRLITDNPKKYYSAIYNQIKAEISEAEAPIQIPRQDDSDDEAEHEQEDPEITPEQQIEEFFKSEPAQPAELPPVIEPAPKTDRYKKVYLSDFIDLPQYDFPTDNDNSLDEDFIADLNEVDSFGRTSLINAVKAGNDWKAKALLAAGADVNAKDNDGWTALMYAVRYQNNLPLLNILLDYNPDVRSLNNYGVSALVLASCYNDNPDIIKTMLSYYSPSEKEVQKAFVLLITTQSISEFTLIAKMKIFIDLGLPVNSYYDGKTPLMYACKSSSSTKAIKLLLDNNANISVRSSEGKTAFEYAAENKNLKHDDIYWSLNKR